MSENPYAAPHAHGPQPAPPLAKAPDTILRKIMAGCIVASLSAAISLFSAISRFAASATAGGIAVSIDAVLIGTCAYGLYRNSRIAALLLLGYYILDRLILLASGNVNGMVLGVIVVIVYLSTAKGTFQYHRWLQQERRLPASQRPRLSDDPLFRTPSAPVATDQPATTETAASTPSAATTPAVSRLPP